jgi:predicted permease
MFQDLRYAARTLVKNRTFTAVVVAALALGIGANTAIFSVVDAVLLRPLPYADPDRIMTVLHDGSDPVAPANYLDWKAQNHVFERMAAAQIGWDANLTGSGHPEPIKTMQVSADMFPLLGVRPLLGRTFLPEEDGPGGARVVVLGHALWQRRFGSDPDLVGRSIAIDDQAFRVVGVMPPGFQFAPFWARDAELWGPIGPTWAPHNLAGRIADRDGGSLRVFARLRSGVTRAQAQAEMDLISRRLERQYPATNKRLTVAVDPLHEKAVGKVRRPLLILLGAVGFVLLIACANVANLLLARSITRRKEIAVRIALGAGRGRLVRQMLTESVLLALLGGGLGVLVAGWSVQFLVALSPASLPRVDTVSLDGQVLGFALAISVLTGLAFGIVPALQASRSGVGESLKEGGRSASAGGHRNRARSVLVVSEVALALVLLVGAGLMVRSFRRLQNLDPGFNPGHLLAVTVPASPAFYDQLIRRVEGLPGVTSVSGINHLPIAGDMWSEPFTVDDRPPPAPGDRPHTVFRLVRPGYAHTMGMSLVAGRELTAHDTLAAPRVAMINETFARTMWPGQNPIGKRIRDDDLGPREIVGVVKDTAQRQWAAEPRRELYRPYLQDARARGVSLVVRTTGDPLALAPAIQREAWAIDNSLPAINAVSMEQVLAGAIGEPRFNALLLNLFAGVALLLAALGIYGVMAHAVTRRGQEIGIRVALGARSSQVLRLVLGQGMALTLLGMVVGLAAAFATTRLMGSLLFEVSATDPPTFVAISLLLAAVALLACYLPARRASRIDPMVALRAE